MESSFVLELSLDNPFFVLSGVKDGRGGGKNGGGVSVLLDWYDMATGVGKGQWYAS